MAGLREKQKAERERRILATATRLFHEHGYDKTKIARIAAEAEVSIGTVYNYYQNKGDLLVAIVSLEVNEVLKAGAELMVSDPRNIEGALSSLFAIYLDHSQIYLNKEMWRHAMAIATRQPESPFGRRYNDLDKRLAHQVCELVARLRTAGLVKESIDATGVGEMLFNNMNMMFTLFVKDDRMTLSTLKHSIARQVRPLADAIRA